MLTCAIFQFICIHYLLTAIFKWCKISQEQEPIGV